MDKLLVLILVCVVAVCFVEGHQPLIRGGRIGRRRPRMEVVEIDEPCTPEKARDGSCQCQAGNWGCDECNKCMCSGQGSYRCTRMRCPGLKQGTCWTPAKYGRGRGKNHVTRTACFPMAC